VDAAQVIRIALRRLAIVAALAATGLLVSLALPIEIWRTGERESGPLKLDAQPEVLASARGVWIDTDAACGAGHRIDADDCLALALLLKSPIEIAGISTVFGNASLELTDWTARQLVSTSAESGAPSVKINRGSALPGSTGNGAAIDALAAELSKRNLVILALGPLTNIAAFLRNRPELAVKIDAIVAVMGSQPGHIFHPSEGGTSPVLLGHGPVFRDFNLAEDVAAVRTVLASPVPLILIPYEGARHLMMTGPDLDRLESTTGASAWAARRSRAWLEYWKNDIGKEGFYPFDLIAAAAFISPGSFGCAHVKAMLTERRRPWRWWMGAEALTVHPLHGPGESGRTALYCPGITVSLHEQIMSGLGATVQ
jgi:inosine-uridine nucleoside N-ribohydrolase